MPPSQPKPAFVGGLFLTSLITPFLLPNGIVRLLPLIGSLVTLIWDADEYYFLSAWLNFNAAASRAKPGPASTNTSTSTSTVTGGDANDRSEREELNRMLGQWHTNWTCSPGVLFAIISLPLSWSSGGITIYRLYASSSSPNPPVAAITFHALGLALAIAHMPVGGKAFPLVKMIGEGRSRLIGSSPKSDSKGSKASGTKDQDALDSIEALRKWSDMHGWRCLTVDLPAFIFFTVGTVLAIA
ncbi:hypothetical protein JCM24511_03464 [Saitozyma sp. JCM 24511]|nr:hypothetical protein JCM24511_03464 [Saitozyma sp. JCM 24511]